MPNSKTKETPFGVVWKTKDRKSHEKWFATKGDRTSFIAEERLNSQVKKNTFSLRG